MGKDDGGGGKDEGGGEGGGVEGEGKGRRGGRGGEEGGEMCVQNVYLPGSVHVHIMYIGNICDLSREKDTILQKTGFENMCFKSIMLFVKTNAFITCSTNVRVHGSTWGCLSKLHPFTARLRF